MADLATHYEQSGSGEQLFDSLPAICCPTLIITGELDAGSTPQMAALLQARIPHARAEVLPGIRHLLPIEAAEDFNARLLGFLDGPSPPRLGPIRFRSGPDTDVSRQDTGTEVPDAAVVGTSLPGDCSRRLH